MCPWVVSRVGWAEPKGAAGGAVKAILVDSNVDVTEYEGSVETLTSDGLSDNWGLGVSGEG